jgi:hypothetical protein
MARSKFKRRQIKQVLALEFDVETSSYRISGSRIWAVGPELTVLTMGTGQVWKEASLLWTADACGATGWSQVFGSPMLERFVHS